MANLNAPSISGGNAAHEDTAAVPAATTAESVAHGIATDVARDFAVAATAVTNHFVDSMLNPTEVHAVADSTASATADTYAAAFKKVDVGDTVCTCTTKTGSMAAAATVVTPIVTTTWNRVPLSEKDRLVFMDTF